MASVATPLEAPKNIVVEKGADFIHATWEGNAYQYKIAYKREEAEVWQALLHSGPGSTSGGTEFDSSPAVASSGSGADFTLSGLTLGIYDVRLINLHTDGSCYTALQKVVVEAAGGTIPNFRVQSTTCDSVVLAWDTPTVASSSPFILLWQQLDEDGRALDNDGMSVDAALRTATVKVLEGDNYRFMLFQPVNAWQNVTADNLVINLKCN